MIASQSQQKYHQSTCQCQCNSKKLYSTDYTSPQMTFKIDGNEVLHKRFYLKNQNQQSNKIVASIPAYQKILQTSQLWLPNQIETICWDQIQFNPIWFYKEFISKNVPCIITNSLEGDDISQRWADQSYLEQVLENQQFSVSLTPDGFADSIKGEYFVQPDQIKTTMKKFFNHQQKIPNAIPYIQHQNSSLDQQFWVLNAEVSQDKLKFLSKHFFKQQMPEAQNFWLGFDNSVSSLHKDPYENFYTTIVGEKHFTLLPPLSILHLQQNNYKNAKWNYSQGKFECISSKENNQTKWITCNPDLKQDFNTFQNLQKIKKFHVTLKKQQMLYLPSLWYHQVSQIKNKDPYTLAINYWFDMEFNQNFSLYQVCRSLKNL